MSSPLITIGSGTSVLRALEIMVGHSIRRLPVVTKGELRGIVTVSDIVVWVLKETYEPNIPKYLERLVEKLKRLEKIA
jgi:predicted transcriptional regulator